MHLSVVAIRNSVKPQRGRCAMGWPGFREIRGADLAPFRFTSPARTGSLRVTRPDFLASLAGEPAGTSDDRVMHAVTAPRLWRDRLTTSGLRISGRRV